jgi:hypothetical protein
MHESMMAPLASESLDLDPANPSSLDIITATRAGTATYTDASGNIQTASPNTVRVDHVQGEELTPTKFQRVKYTDFSSGWNNLNATSQAGDGYLGQPSLIVNAPVLNSRTTTSVPTETGVSYTASFYVRYVSGSSGLVWMYRQFSGEGATATPITVTSEWTRVQVQFTGGSGSNVNFGVSPKVAGESVEIAMPQVEEGAITDFVANTTGSPKYFAAATYGPRVPMILVEPAATNLIDYSDLNPVGAWSSTGFNVTQNAILSPDGLNNGTKLEQTSTVRNFAGTFITSSTGTSVTYSFWIKKGSGDTHLNTFIIRNNSRSPHNMRGSINLETGEIIQNEFGAGNIIVESYPNGWFKVKATRDTDISVGDDIRIYPPYSSSDGSNEIGQYNYTFGHQAEQGTVATSFIPTSGSAVTRAADDLVIDGSDFTDFFNSGGDGTFYAEAVFRQDDNGDGQSLLYGQSNSYRFLYGWDGRMRAYDGATIVSTSPASFTVGNLARAAVTFNSSTIGISLDGSTTVSGSHNGNLSSATELNVGNSSNYYLNGHIKRVIYWPHHSDNL